jgi:transmembrane sensor
MEKEYIERQLSLMIGNRSNQTTEEQAAEAAAQIASIDDVDSHQAYKRVEARIKTKLWPSVFINFLIRTAAILFIPVLGASVYLYLKQSAPLPNKQYAVQEITSPPGVRSHVVLPDGSKAWINAESTIRFHVPFESGSRAVILQGEAYFDVVKNEAAPFVVNAGPFAVKVLGTEFNVKAYKEDADIEVVLKKGRVSLGSHKSSVESDVVIHPGERAVIDRSSGKLSVHHGQIEKYIAWHKGKLVFDETLMPEVAAQLERWYGIEVEVQDARVKTYRITTTFENEPLHQVLELLRLSSPIDIRYIPGTMGDNHLVKTRAKVIIRSKPN